MSEDCPHCIFEKTEANCRGCFEGSHYRPKPVTNYDRLVSKGPEGLAGYLAPCACPPIYFDKTGVIDCPVGREPCESDCKHCWLEYLKQEAKE